MNLKSCHIDGFGKLRDRDYDFRDGLNTFEEKNGAGKTTLSVFLKAMFYGLPTSRKRILTEREHYCPWDGGTYGGSLDFEVEDKTYRIERTFGKRERDDTYQMIDLATGREATGYSENPGEELFGVDREAFEKSIYFGQDDLMTGMTDSLNAKMGDLATAKNDVSRFDTAVAEIEEAKKKYTVNGKNNKGIIPSLKKQISYCTEESEKLPALMSAYAKQSSLLDEKRADLKRLEADKKQIAEAIAGQAKKEQEFGAYKAKRQQLAADEQDIKSLDDFFAGGIPEAEEIAKAEERERELHGLQKQIEEVSAKLPDIERQIELSNLFREHTPGDEEIAAFRADAARIRELRTQSMQFAFSEEDQKTLQELSDDFSRHMPTEEELFEAQSSATEIASLQGQLRIAEERYQKLSAREEAVGRQRRGRRSPKVNLLFMILLSVISFGGGAMFFLFVDNFLTQAVFTLIFMAFGTLFLVIGLMNFSHSRKTETQSENSRQSERDEALIQLQQIRKELKEATQRCRNFLKNYKVTPTDSYQEMVTEIRTRYELYKRLRDESERNALESSGMMEELSALQLRTYTALAPYASVYGMDLYQEENETELLHRMTADLVDYTSMSESLRRKNELSEQNRKLSKEVAEFISRFPTEDPGASASDQIKEIQVRFVQYETLNEKIEQEQKELADFEETHDVHEQTESVADLQARQEETDEKIADLNRLLAQEREHLQNLSEQIVSVTDEAGKLDGLRSEEKQAQEKVKLFDDTIGYLQEARDRFLSRYMKPLSESMRRYFTQIDPAYAGGPEEISLDIDLSLHVRANGCTRDGQMLSRGYRDLAYLCVRLALVDVLYRKERPVLILDDPFANFDDEKIRLGRQLLASAAEKYQIIYFTCHPSRG